MTPRATVRFNGGEHETDSLPYDRAERVALRGLSEHGIYQGGYAELIDVETAEVALHIEMI